MSDKQGLKYDMGKTRFDLLPFRPLEEIAEVFTFGAVKYSDNGWKKVRGAKTRYAAALLRHVNSYMQGQKKDPESGLSHLAHAGACILILLWFNKRKCFYINYLYFFIFFIDKTFYKEYFVFT